MKKVFSIKKYVKSCYDGDYLKALESFSVNTLECEWVFTCANKTLEECEKMGYKISLEWCELYAETKLDKEITIIMLHYGFNDYSILYDYERKPYRVILRDTSDDSLLDIYSRYFKCSFEIYECSTILYNIEKIQKLLD